MKIGEVQIGKVYQLRNLEPGEHSSTIWGDKQNIPVGYPYPAKRELKTKYKGSKVQVELSPAMMFYVMSLQIDFAAWVELVRVAGGWLNLSGNRYYVIEQGEINYVPPQGPWPVPPRCEPLTSIGNEVKVIGKNHDWVQIESIPAGTIPPSDVTPASHPHLFCAPFTSIGYQTNELGNALDSRGVVFPLWTVGEAWLPADWLQEVDDTLVVIPNEPEPMINQDFVDAFYQRARKKGHPEEKIYGYLRGAGLTKFAEPYENRWKEIPFIPDPE